MKRQCTNCNWEYPATYHSLKCKFCKTILEYQYCKGCSKWVITDRFVVSKYLCKDCARELRKEYDRKSPDKYNARSNRVYHKHMLEIDMQLQEWTKNTTDFKPLSQQDWLKTCEYFGGCALCNEEYIETRQFFIPFKEGGRYTAWNMFPMCGKCATHTRRIKNPFLWLYRHRYEIPEEKRTKLVQYLKLQIEGVQ